MTDHQSISKTVPAQRSSPDIIIDVDEYSINWRKVVVALGAGILSIGGLVLLITGNVGQSDIPDRLQGVTTVFLGIFIEAVPFLLAGVLVSALIQTFAGPSVMHRLPRHPLAAALTGALLGFIFPVCECGAVPTGRQMLRNGATAPLGLAFLVAAPAVNPIVVASTWIAFNGDLKMVLGRTIVTIFVATLLGVMVGLHPRPPELLQPEAREHQHRDTDQSCCTRRHVSRGRQILDHSLSEFFEMGRFMVAGALIAALLQIFIPQGWLLGLGHDPLTSVLVLMALAVILSICSTVDAFVALSFSSIFSTGAILAFLTFGPIIDLKSLLMFSTTLSRRLTLLLVLVTFQVVFLAAVFVNLNFN